MRHGATVLDQYYWLREKTNPQVVQYLESENNYTEAMTKGLQPFQDALCSLLHPDQLMLTGVVDLHRDAGVFAHLEVDVETECIDPLPQRLQIAFVLFRDLWGEVVGWRPIDGTQIFSLGPDSIRRLSITGNALRTCDSRSYSWSYRRSCRSAVNALVVRRRRSTPFFMSLSAKCRPQKRATWQPGAESGFSGISLATPNGDLRR